MTVQGFLKLFITISICHETSHMHDRGLLFVDDGARVHCVWEA